MRDFFEKLPAVEKAKILIANSKDHINVITTEINNLADGKPASIERKETIERNVEHLKTVVQNKDVVESEQNVDEITAAIAVGEAKLAENIWQT